MGHQRLADASSKSTSLSTSCVEPSGQLSVALHWWASASLLHRLPSTCLPATPRPRGEKVDCFACIHYSATEHQNS